MDIDQLVTDTFTEREHLAPTEDDILPGARRRLAGAGPRRHRRGSGPLLAVAASIAVVLAIGVVVLVARHRSGPDRPAAPAGSFTMPFDLRWLPPGQVTYLSRSVTLGSPPTIAAATGSYETSGYYLFVSTASGQVDISVDQMVGPRAGSLVCGRPTKSVGLGAGELREAIGSCGYQGVFVGPGGTTMSVTISAGARASVSIDQLRDIGRRVGAGIRFPGTTTVTPDFGLGRLPAGLRVGFVSVSTGAGPLVGTNYELVGGSTQHQLSVEVRSSVGLPPGADGRLVQGHHTQVSRLGANLALHAPVHGRPGVLITSGTVPLAQLYEIAESLVLPR